MFDWSKKKISHLLQTEVTGEVKKKLSTEPYKGVRDFYPEDQAVQNYLFKKMSETAQSFGYNEYNASILEPTELYEAKSGDELVKEQTYSFIDRGERNVTLRPEMTPTIARMVAEKQRELLFPIRWYSIPNVFRYERPQRGRLREHWQLNVDLFDASGVDADSEIISLAYQLLKNTGAQENDFVIKINYAGQLAEYLKEKFNISDEKINTLVKVIDRYSKISQEEFKNRAEVLITTEQVSELTTILEHRTDDWFSSQKGTEYLEKLVLKLSELGIQNTVIDPFLTRGFDYYTGMVFEVYDTHSENNRSIFGGGRYDNLLEIFDVEKVPAVGFGVGDVPLRNFLEVRNLLPEYISTTHLMLCTLSQENIPFAQKLAQNLRKQGLNISVNLTDKKIDKQIKTAGKQNIPYVICIGENEEKTGTFKIKNLMNGEEKEVNEGEIKNNITT